MQKKIAEEREIKAWISNLIRTARLWDTTKFPKSLKIKYFANVSHFEVGYTYPILCPLPRDKISVTMTIPPSVNLIFVLANMNERMELSHLSF